MVTQNRPEEAPRDEKQRLRRRQNKKSREEGQQEHPRGAQDGSLAPEKPPRDPQEHPRGAQEAPKRPPRAPKRGPREPQDALKTIFGSKTLIFQKSSCRLGGGSIFAGWRVIWGAKNRLRGARRGGKDDLEKDKNKRSSEESLKKLPRSPKVTIYRACQRFRASTRARGRLV